MKNNLMIGLLLGALTLVAGPASADTYYLCAEQTTKTMPDGDVIPMWGYAEDDNGDLSDGCGTGEVTFPGPRLAMTDGSGALTINLLNNLPEPTSITVPGLPMPVSAGGWPTWNNNATGPRPSADARVRSFGAEAPAGGTESYSWTGVRPGTFIYHSGTHPQKQVYMGLYGAVTQDSAPGEAYPAIGLSPAVAYDNEVVLFYSEIDPHLNDSVDGGTYETSIDYHAKWFLINGEPYSTDCTDVDVVDGFDDLSGYSCFDMAQTESIQST